MSYLVAGLEIILKILSNSAWSLIILCFFWAAIFFYGLTAGRKKLLSVLFSMYASIIISDQIIKLDFRPILFFKNFSDIFFTRILIFAVLFIIINIIFSKRIFSGVPEIRKEKLWQLLILSFLDVGLLLSYVYRILPDKNLLNLSQTIEWLFASEKSFLCWAVLPIVALLFIVKKRKKIG